MDLAHPNALEATRSHSVCLLVSCRQQADALIVRPSNKFQWISPHKSMSRHFDVLRLRQHAHPKTRLHPKAEQRPKKSQQNLPFHPTQFATLEIETRKTNVTQAVAFFHFES
jgi:hypothetical protein